MKKSMSRRGFLKNTGLAATAVAGGVVGLALTGPSASASTSIHNGATVKGFFPVYRALCPCGWKHSGTTSNKDRAWAWSDQHQIDNGIRP